MKSNALVVMDESTEEVKIVIGDHVRGRYKNRYELASHLASALLTIDENTKRQQQTADRVQSFLLELLDVEMPEWARDKIRAALVDNSGC